CTLGQAEVDNFYGSDAEGQAIANLIRNLYEIGQNGTATYKTPVSNINKSGNITLSGDYYIQNYDESKEERYEREIHIETEDYEDMLTRYSIVVVEVE
ncbi:MAG: hypothetical protein IJH55_03865, partial [Romboutsia sp.]|nr:hypothetical protein [Romboutsia sp.]